jgi:hypothetical protein
MIDNLDIEIYDFLDLLSFTLSKEFISKWRFKYGERMVRLFQLKILDSLKNSKTIKVKSIFKYLSTDSGFAEEAVRNFFIDIDYTIYYPILVGSVDDILKVAHEQKAS